MGDFGEVGAAVFGKEVTVILFEGLLISGDGANGCAKVVGNGVGEFFELAERFLKGGGARGDFLFKFCGMLTDSWRAASSCCWTRFSAVMSRAILEAPMNSPNGSLIGETVREISMRRPSLVLRTVSKCSRRSPRRMRLMTFSSS